MAKNDPRDPGTGYDDHELWNNPPWANGVRKQLGATRTPPVFSPYGDPRGTTGVAAPPVPPIDMGDTSQRAIFSPAGDPRGTNFASAAQIPFSTRLPPPIAAQVATPEANAQPRDWPKPPFATPEIIAGKQTPGQGTFNPGKDFDPVAGVNPAAQNTMKGFTASGVPGIYKAVAPDGSVTYTDRPGGTWAASGTLQHTPGVRPYVDDALTARGVQTPTGEMGTGTGNFSAASIPANAPGLRYQPPDPPAMPSRGDKKGLAPGTTAWFNANAAPMNPLESQDAANQYAADQIANNQARRGDGRFNTTVYDPTGYRQAQAPTAVSPFGMGGAGGLDAMNKLSEIQARQDETEINRRKVGNQENKAAADEIDTMAKSPDIISRAAKYDTEPNTLATILYGARHPESSLAEANARKALASHTAKMFNANYGPIDRAASWGGNMPSPEPLPGGDAPELPYEWGKDWMGRPALLSAPRNSEDQAVPRSDKTGLRNAINRNPWFGKSGTELHQDDEVGPYFNKLAARDAAVRDARLKEIAKQERDKAQK